MFPENWLYHLEIIHKGLRLGKSRNVFLSVLSFQSDPGSMFPAEPFCFRNFPFHRDDWQRSLAVNR